MMSVMNDADGSSRFKCIHVIKARGKNNGRECRSRGMLGVCVPLYGCKQNNINISL